jgi:PHD/YefM family antitoxin component YafN of YafNO toxin-antitoxin module
MKKYLKKYFFPKNMFPEQFKKILNLIKKTGDRVIIFDPNEPDNSYVVMDLDKYASLVNAEELVKKHPVAENSAPVTENLTEEDLTDKINREILMWKNQKNASYLGEENKPKKPWQIPAQIKEKAQGVE